MPLGHETNRQAEIQASPLNQVLIIHERIGFWVRQLRPRMAEPGFKIIETRSGADIDAALSAMNDPFPLALLDLGRRPAVAMEELDRLKQGAPDALILVIDPDAHDEIHWSARELGATYVISGRVTPPEVARLLSRWKRLAGERALKAGWRAPLAESSEPEPWNWISAIIKC